ncbi:MAG: hemolysin III family protein, partial [Rhizobacter sp.]
MATLNRDQTGWEELANSISHGIGFLLAIASLPLLLAFSGPAVTAINIVAMCIFSATMMLLYGISTLYHALPAGRAKTWLNRCDHAAIYLFIAGSYTPFVLGVLR